MYADAPVPVNPHNPHDITYNGNPYHNRAGHTREEIHWHDRLIAKEKINPLPPSSNLFLKVLTFVVLTLLVGALVVYIVYTIRAYNQDREYPKSSIKLLNKGKDPLDFPSVTVCSFASEMDAAFNLDSCFIIDRDFQGAELTPDKNCSETALRRQTWTYAGQEFNYNCYIINSKSALHTEAYKATRSAYGNAMAIGFNTSVGTDLIGVLITAWDQVPNVTNLVNPTTWTANSQFTILNVERYERAFIDQPAYTEWDIYRSTLFSGENYTTILLHFKALQVESTKEEHTYSIITVIANISAAAGELLGFSFFELYVMLLATIYLLYDRSYQRQAHL